ncbi:MAG TPA: hypothetical protein VMU24_02275, partial [Candidatus Acidoferrales bacterium]|nr:hypothetical protein [Candidatus Acidoferrales bacterium]
GGFALFDSYDSGLAAMQSLLQSKISAHPDWDFYDLTSNWVYGKDVPPAGDPQNANAYADYIAQQLGTDATSSLDETFGG